MTDFETKYRALREGVEALHVVAVNPTDWCADWCAACGRAWPCPTIALLAPSPAEGTGEQVCAPCSCGQLCKCSVACTCGPAPVSSGEAGDYCDCGQYGCPNPAPVVAPSADGDES